MLLTITYKGSDTQNLGYLLHKNPYRAQSFDMSFGKAYVFYPEVSDAQTTMACCSTSTPLIWPEESSAPRKAGFLTTSTTGRMFPPRL